SRETTFATGPLRPDGVIDYVGAINALLADVKPAENAAVLLVEAYGPNVTTPPVADEYFRRLGCPPPAGKSSFQGLRDFAKAQHADGEGPRANFECCQH